jgi:hypothetical protein
MRVPRGESRSEIHQLRHVLTEDPSYTPPCTTSHQEPPEVTSVGVILTQACTSSFLLHACTRGKMFTR